MPRGHCRYILLNAEIKGQRCACVGFSHNRGIPGATCDCGHLACYHNKEPESSSDQKSELELLKRRIQQLESQLSKDQDDALDAVVSRLNGLEESLEKSRDEFSEQIKGTYRNININWHSVEQVARKAQQQDAQLRHLYEKAHDQSQQIQKLNAAQMELRDADLSLEERIENLTETIEDDAEIYRARAGIRRPRRRSTSDSSRPNIPLGPLGAGDGPLESHGRPGQAPGTAPRPRGHGDAYGRDDTRAPQQWKPVPASARSTGAWTVHISLLPHASVPMPFERNTNAYQRCLSRGLHQMVAVNGKDALSFTTAVEKAFGMFLKGRPWMPLQAKLCDVQTLQGLPMLRKMEPHLVKMPYSHEFLRQNCAVCDAGGVIDSLYIAMQHDTISWHRLKHSRVFVEGLEGAWAYDALLDGVDPFDEDMAVSDGERPAAGDITTALLPTLKRPLTEMSRSNSFGSTTSPVGESEPHRAKRACPAPVPVPPPSASGAIVEMRRRLETA